MDPLIQKLKKYRDDDHLTSKQVAEQLGVPYSTVKSWLGPNPEEKLSAKHSDRVQGLLDRTRTDQSVGTGVAVLKLPDGVSTIPKKTSQNPEAKRRASKLKMLLLLTEDELRWFCDGEIDRRDAYREALDPFDIGYISSLLSMLTEEEKFQRWKILTTNRFNSFGRRRTRNAANRSDQPKHLERPDVPRPTIPQSI